MARRNVRIQRIANRKARLAAFLRGRAKLVEKAEKLSALCNVSIAVVTHGPAGGKAKPTVWPAAPEATVILQRYASDDYSGKNGMDQEEFLRLRIAKLRTQIARNEAAVREGEARLILHDLFLGRNVNNVPFELIADIKKLVEQRMEEVADRINHLSSL